MNDAFICYEKGQRVVYDHDIEGYNDTALKEPARKSSRPSSHTKVDVGL